MILAFWILRPEQVIWLRLTWIHNHKRSNFFGMFIEYMYRKCIIWIQVCLKITNFCSKIVFLVLDDRWTKRKYGNISDHTMVSSKQCKTQRIIVYTKCTPKTRFSELCSLNWDYLLNQVWIKSKIWEKEPELIH